MPCLTRRGLLGLPIAVLAMRGDDAARAAQSSKKQPANVSVEAWMDQWMRRRSPDGTLHISRFRDPMYFLLKPIGWKPDGDQVGKYQPISVPQGFVTDFASVPRLFWSLLRPDGDYTYPAIVHDWMYWRQDTDRETADEILRLGMQDFSIDKATVAAIYNAVRLGAGSAWNANAAEKKGGGRRILTKTPDDPRITWADWKKKPDVFGAE
jgi:hypothetical protein